MVMIVMKFPSGLSLAHEFLHREEQLTAVFLIRSLEDTADVAALIHEGEVCAVNEEILGNDAVGIVNTANFMP